MKTEKNHLRKLWRVTDGFLKTRCTTSGVLSIPKVAFGVFI